jgi:hypothetical protein
MHRYAVMRLNNNALLPNLQANALKLFSCKDVNGVLVVYSAGSPKINYYSLATSLYACLSWCNTSSIEFSIFA